MTRFGAKIDWPLAIELALAFVVMSYARWRWFKARLRQGAPPTAHRDP